MTTRGGSRRDLYRAIEERDRIIAELREELAGLREALGNDGPFNDGERLTRDGLPFTAPDGAQFYGDRA